MKIEKLENFTNKKIRKFKNRKILNSLVPEVENKIAPPISKTAKSVAPVATEIPAIMAFRLTLDLFWGFSSIKGSPLMDSTGVELLICAKLCFSRDPILCEKLMGRIVKLEWSTSLTVDPLGKMTQALGPSDTRDARPRGTD